MRPLFLLCALLLSLPSAAEDKADKKVMMLPVQGTASGADLRAVEAQLRVAFVGVSGFELVSVAATAGELEAAKEMGLSCAADDEDCLARLALVMPAARLVATWLDAGDEGGLRLRMDVYDSATAGLLQRVERALPPVGPARAPVLQEAAAVLLAPERFVGALVVKLVPPFTRASLDGADARAGPEVRFDSVPAGTHIVTAFAGERQTTQTVEVAPGEVARVALGGGAAPADDVSEADPAMTLWPYTVGGGVAAAGLLVALVGAGTSVFLLADLNFTGIVFGGSGYDTRQAALLASYVATGTAVLGTAAAAAGLVLFATGPAL
jgi:hypothetical protein